jgi:hypothetical protein
MRAIEAAIKKLRRAQSMGNDGSSWNSPFAALGGRLDDAESRARKACERLPAPPASVAARLGQVSLSRAASQRSAASERSATTDLNPLSEPPPHSPGPKSSRGRPGPKPAALDAKPPTSRERELFQLSLAIEEREAQGSADLAFLSTAMVYASLPHSQVSGAIYKRRNGPVSLSILNDPEIGLPYGKIPRLITAYLCSEAKRNHKRNGRVIYLGRSEAEFMHRLGLRSRGGVRGEYRRVRDQAQRLFTSTITLVGVPNSHFEWSKVSISEDGMLLWDPHDPHKKGRWRSFLVLSEKFFNECVRHAVPIKMWVLHQLRSPLSIDIYIWLTYRYHALKEPQPISWQQLQWQFGANYAPTAQGHSNFKTNFRRALRQVLALYRDARLIVRQDLIVLLPSKPHVASVEEQVGADPASTLPDPTPEYPAAPQDSPSSCPPTRSGGDPTPFRMTRTARLR